jgi:hypothetical protein
LQIAGGQSAASPVSVADTDVPDVVDLVCEEVVLVVVSTHRSNPSGH